MINEVTKLFSDLIKIAGGQKSEKETCANTNAKRVSMNSHFVSDLSVLILKGLLVAFQR